MSAKPRREANVRDVLIPHLNATLTLGWQAPPSSVSVLLGRVKETEPRSLGLKQIADRCGEAALGEVRRIALQDQTFCFDRMCQAQRRVTPELEPRFRPGVAFTSIRPERYAYFDDLESMFRTKITKDAEDACHPVLKAIRLYLDVIFVHPFVDGNARAAMLAFAFFAFRHGFDLPDFRKLHGFGFVPGNRSCYWLFSSLIIQDLVIEEVIRAQTV